MNAKRFAVSVPLFAVASLLACSSPAPTTDSAAEHVGVASSAVIKGTPSDKTQDDVLLLIHYDPTQQGVESCSGTLLSDRVLLTARHCVADTDESAACDITGAPISQGVVRGNHPANTLYAFIGQNRPDFNNPNIVPDGIGATVLDDGGTNLCNHDIAIVILKNPIPNAKIAQLRLDSPVKKGEFVTAVGWGVTDTTPEPNVRQQRTGIQVQGIGPDDTQALPLPPNEFEVGESICSGDSGGPAFAKTTNAIVGIVSRGGNATQPDPNNPAAGCVGVDAENIYTKVAPFKTFITNALAMVGTEPWLEGGPDPRLAKADTACTDASQCRSNLCLADPSMAAGTLTCATDCADGAVACPDGQTCTAIGTNMVCRAPAAAGSSGASGSGSGQTITTTSGCATSPGEGSSGSGALGFVLAALGLVALRRKHAR
jgi:MYXO-CTERM domain-containing protein